ncbi:MAG: hypothetical protein GY801_22085 [bacterium]|nr:hypothetical protein [bacterium]
MDFEFDVISVGAGRAGLYAALEAGKTVRHQNYETHQSDQALIEGL